jgi:hypothetical protein
LPPAAQAAHANQAATSSCLITEQLIVVLSKEWLGHFKVIQAPLLLLAS